MDAAPTIDRVALERAEGWIRDLEKALGKAELATATLRGFCDEGLGQAIVGVIAGDVESAKSQLRPLMQAVRDMPLMEERGRGA